MPNINPPQPHGCGGPECCNVLLFVIIVIFSLRRKAFEEDPAGACKRCGNARSEDDLGRSGHALRADNTRCLRIACCGIPFTLVLFQRFVLVIHILHFLGTVLLRIDNSRLIGLYI